VAGLAVEIATRAQDGERHFDIRLDPPELGRIEVHLNVDSAGHVTSHLVADRPDTLDLLRRDAPTLERALQSAGLKTDDGAMQFSLRDQSLAGGYQQTPRDTATVSRLVVPDPEFPPVDTAVRGYGRLAGMGSGVDIRV
jgi:chemotaxis protein MotD